MISEEFSGSNYTFNFIEDYIDKSGLNAFIGNPDYCWILHEKFSGQRFPEFILSNPDESEIRKVFKELKCALIGYTIMPDDISQANAFLYECRNVDYDIDKLESSSVRRNIRYGQRNLKYGFCEWEDILKNGLQAFSDTRSKVGLSDGTEKNFRKRFKEFSQNKYHKAVAAWYENQMVGFMSLIVLDNFAIIEGTFSTNEHKKYKTNNVLTDFVLRYFLSENKYEVVSYGLSSIQEEADKEGLHNFKTSVGFTAIPIKRVFVLNPFLSKFQKLIKGFLHFLKVLFPKNRFLRKASGIFNYLK